MRLINALNKQRGAVTSSPLLWMYIELLYHTQITIPIVRIIFVLFPVIIKQRVEQAYLYYTVFPVGLCSRSIKIAEL